MWTTRPRFKTDPDSDTDLYYCNAWVGGIRGPHAKRRAEEICKCMNSHQDLLDACRVAVLALTHEPINPDDIKFIEDAVANAK